MANASVELHLLQRVGGHQDPAVTSRYLHPTPKQSSMRALRSPAGGPHLVRISRILVSWTAAEPEHEKGPDLREQIRARFVGLTVPEEVPEEGFEPSHPKGTGT